MRYILLLPLLGMVLASTALAHDPEKDKWADWFMSLKEPDHPNVSCCGPSDQYWVDEYIFDPSDRSFMARVEDRWIKVPPEKVDWKSINPTGRGVLFLTVPTSTVPLCFIPGLGM